MTERKCENCNYWVLSEDFRTYPEESEHHDIFAIGWCKRYPPTKYLAEFEHNIHIETEDSEWCGEFKPRQVE